MQDAQLWGEQPNTRCTPVGNLVSTCEFLNAFVSPYSYCIK